MTVRPRVTLKLATSLDGRIATAGGESKWITGPEARRVTHQLRAVHDAVLVGIGTALADDPELTVRLDEPSVSPRVRPRPVIRVVLDSAQRLPSAARLVQTARKTPTLLLTVGEPDRRLTDAGVVVVKVPDQDGRPAPAAVVEALAAQGIGSMMIEGGGQVAAAFVNAGLVDALEWFRAPVLLGAEGRPAVGALALQRLAEAPRWRRTAVREVGADLWERYERA